MKKIKSAQKDGTEIAMKEYQGNYYLLCNDLTISFSPDYSNISEMFDKFIGELKTKKHIKLH